MLSEGEKELEEHTKAIVDFCNKNGKLYLTLSTLEQYDPSISFAMQDIIYR
jgi:hypothetical protein